jgi:hypothetical protein
MTAVDGALCSVPALVRIPCASVSPNSDQFVEEDINSVVAEFLGEEALQNMIGSDDVFHQMETDDTFAGEGEGENGQPAAQSYDAVAVAEFDEAMVPNDFLLEEDISYEILSQEVDLKYFDNIFSEVGDVKVSTSDNNNNDNETTATDTTTTPLVSPASVPQQLTEQIGATPEIISLAAKLATNREAMELAKKATAKHDAGKVKRKRKPKVPVPEHLKDERYLRKRAKNTEAARRYRKEQRELKLKRKAEQAAAATQLSALLGSKIVV